MLKVDNILLRQQLADGYAKMLANLTEPSEQAAMLRAIPMMIELNMYCVGQMSRHESDPLIGIVRIARVVGNVLSNPCLNITEKEGTVLEPDEMTGAHAAIHVMTEEISQAMHIVLAERTGIIPHDVKDMELIPLPVKDVGDA